MSNKKYDLGQVSEATKDAYLAVILRYSKGGHCSDDFERARCAFFREAEVKPKTAREILEQFLEGESRYYENTYDDACAAIKDALKVLP